MYNDIKSSLLTEITVLENLVVIYLSTNIKINSSKYFSF